MWLAVSALTPLVKYRHIPCILPVAEVFQVPSLARYWRGAFVSQQCKSPIPKGEMKCLMPLALPRYKRSTKWSSVCNLPPLGSAMS